MSTSELASGIPQPPDEGYLPGAWQTLPEGLPDPAILARIANEIFRQGMLPGGPEVPTPIGGLAVPLTTAPATPLGLGVLPSTAVAEVMPSVSSLALPTEAGLQAGSANPVGLALSPPALQPPGSASPGVAGGVSAADFSAVPSFGFLQDIRTLGATPPAVPGQVVPAETSALPSQAEARARSGAQPEGSPSVGVSAGLPLANGVPTEAGLRELPSTLPAASSLPTGLSATSMPGGVSAGDFTSVASYDFLQEARSIAGSAQPAASVSPHSEPTPPQASISPVATPKAPTTDHSSFPLPVGEANPPQTSLHALPTTLPDAAGPSQESAASGIPTPGLAGGVSPADFSTAPAFAFIEEGRTQVSPPPVIPVQSATTAPKQTELWETALHAIPASLGGQLPEIPESATEVSAPQIDGVVTNPSAPRSGSPGFLEQAKPLEPANYTPRLAPITPEPGVPDVAVTSSAPFDVAAVRRDFPILQERINGRPLIWLDNAATTQKPQAVIDRLAYFYAHENSNIHRAAHTLAARSTDAYEGAREKVRRFLNAPAARDIIFVRGATEGINLVAQSWGRRNINQGDEVVITWLEHHANIVPWQMLCAEKGARLRVAPVDDRGQILLDEYEKLLGPSTRLVSLTQVSNALGTVTPVTEMAAMAHRHGARVLVDGAQAVSHMPVDVQALNCDFYTFSGHKVFAPTGIGVVYGRSEVLNAMPPWQGGGNMIADVTFEKTLYQPPPARFEAGTGNIADAVGLGAAIDYLDRIGMANIARYEHDLLLYATEALQRIPGLRLIGTAREKAGVLSFVLNDFRSEDVGTALNREGIAVRSGHHCAQPILRRFGVESTVRPSLALYNTCQEIDTLVTALWSLKTGRHPGLL